MQDPHYTLPKLVEIYDDLNPWSSDNDFYCALVQGKDKLHILDLGCGTGVLANSYSAQGHFVTAVDPSKEMIAVGRQKEYGAHVDWILAKAQELTLRSKFDLIVMTGHAFQVLLQREEVLQVFELMRDCLKEEGLIVFETRNPHTRRR